MDAVTHGLASYALARAVFPRASLVTLVGAILAGTIADVDGLSAQFGPAAYLAWQRTYMHSLAAAICIALIVTVGVLLALRHKAQREPAGEIFLLAAGASLLHVGMDILQNENVEALWPFRAQRYSADLLAHFDLWILLILLAGVLLPRLFALVTEEIGAKSRAPRGRVGAIIALAAVTMYAGARYVLHGNALGMMEAHTYRGEAARKLAAFAEPGSPLRWRGVVETERALRDLEVNLGAGASFDANAGFVSYKPEMSPALEAAQKTGVARRFVQAIQFPKANVEKTSAGYRVEIRDFVNQRDPRSGSRVMAVVETDPTGNVTSQELVWEPLK